MILSKIKYKVTQKGTMKYLKNTSWLLFEKIIRMGVGLFVGVWVTRYLGKELFGTYSYVQSLIGVLTIFATLGLDGILIRELVDDKSEKEKILGTAFGLRILGTILVYFTLFLLLNYIIQDKSIELFVYIFALTLFFQILHIFEFYFKSKVITKYFTISSLTAFCISAILKIIFIQMQKTLIFFVWIAVIESMILGLILFYFFKKNSNISIRNFSFDQKLAITLLKESWPLIINFFALTLYLKMDQLMLMHYSGDGQVGVYSAALRLSEIWAFIPAIVCTSLFPAIVNAKSISNELYYKRLQSLYDLMIWSAILLAIPISLLSDYIIHFLYGQEYISSSFVLKTHIWTGIFTFFGYAWFNWILIEKYQRTNLYMNLLSLSANFAMNILLIPSYGAKGAALATLITYSLNHTFFALFFKNQKIAIKMFWNSFNLKRIYYEIRSSINSRQ